jgi:hypothetical protein
MYQSIEAIGSFLWMLTLLTDVPSLIMRYLHTRF